MIHLYCYACGDINQYGLGAIHLQNDHTIDYLNRTPTVFEQKRAQINELLAFVYHIKEFSDCTFGRPIHMCSDQKPLVMIANKPLGRTLSRLHSMLVGLSKIIASWTSNKASKYL